MEMKDEPLMKEEPLIDNAIIEKTEKTDSQKFEKVIVEKAEEPVN